MKETALQICRDRMERQQALYSADDEFIFRIDNSHIVLAADSVDSSTDLSFAIGIPFAAIFAESDRPVISSKLGRTTEKREIVQFISDCELPSGKTLNVHATVSPLSVQDRSLGAVIHCQEIPFESVADDSPDHARRMQTVGELAAGVAHDFNNLLTVITGYSELLVPTVCNDASASNALEGIRQAARQAAGVTRSLLMLSAKNPPHPEYLDLRSLTRQTISLLRRLMPASIEVEYDNDDQSPIWVFADGVQLQQAIMNLVINARDAMIDGGSLDVSVRLMPSNAALSDDWSTANMDTSYCAEITIHDTGPGIPPKICDRVFEPFVTTKPPGKGTGLGLAIVRRIVHHHNGNIEFESSPGTGTTFAITLPAVHQSCSHETSDISTTDLLVWDKRVLLAEDDWNVRSIISATLRQVGFIVVEAADGHCLSQHITNTLDGFDLLIFDNELPGKAGLDCLSDARSLGWTVPAMIITGGELDPGQLGPDTNTTILHKPFSMSELRHISLDLLYPVAQTTA